MSTRIRTADAEVALRRLIEAEVLAACGGNALVSRAEGLTLSAYVHRVELTLRAEGGRGARVRTDRLIERAVADALAVWERFNPASAPLDHRWLAQDELAAITRADALVGETTQRALALMGTGAPPSSAPPAADPAAALAALQAEIGALNLYDAPDPTDAVRIDARTGHAGRASLPTAAQEAFDFYYRVEARDIGSARLYRLDRSGLRFYALLCTTDGDDAWLEVLDTDGAWLAGARFYGGVLAQWDPFPRRARLSHFWTVLAGFRREEGLSEEDERVAAGQPSRSWTGEVQITDGSITPAGRLIGPIDTGGATLTEAQRELATAAFEHLWEMLLRYRVTRSEPLVIGSRRQGVLTLGDFTRRSTGQSYATAWWRDIDDGSFVLYYSRDGYGLRLAIEQFDN